MGEDCAEGNSRGLDRREIVDTVDLRNELAN